MYTDVTSASIGWNPTGTISITAVPPTSGAPTVPIQSLSAGQYFVPAGTYAVSSSETVPEDVYFVFEYGAKLVLGSAVSLELATVPDASTSEIFTIPQTAKIRFRVIDRPVWADWFGAESNFKDGVQAAMDAVSGFTPGSPDTYDRAGVVQLSGRTYSASDGVIGRPGVWLRGIQNSQQVSASCATVIEHSGNNTLITFSARGQDTGKFDISDLKVKAADSALTGSAAGAVEMNGQISRIERLHIIGYGGGFGIRFRAVTYDVPPPDEDIVVPAVGVAVRDNRIQGCKHNVLVESHCTTIWIANNRLEDCTQDGAAIKIHTSDGLVCIRENLIESNRGKGIWVDGTSYQVQVSNNWFEANGANKEDIHLEGSASAQIRCVHIVGNRINSSGVLYGIRADYLQDSLLEANLFGVTYGAPGVPANYYHLSLGGGCVDNLCLWNAGVGRYQDSGTRNIRNERNAVNELGTVPKARGDLNLNGFTLKDAAAPSSPSLAWVASTPEGVVTEDPASVRLATSVGAIFVKASGPGNTGWRRVPIIGAAWSTLTVNNGSPSVSPDSTQGENFVTANTTATSITNFSNGVNGQRILLKGGDQNTTFINGSTLATSNGQNLRLRVGQIYQFVLDGTVWREITRPESSGARRLTSAVPFSAGAQGIYLSELDLALAPGEVAELEYVLFVTVASGTNGVAPIFDLPTGAAGTYWCRGSASSASSETTAAPSTSPGTEFSAKFVTAPFTGTICVKATIRNGSNADDLRLGLNAGASVSGTVLADSTVRFTRIT